MTMTSAATVAEQDARAHHSGGHITPDEIAIGVIMGRTSEFFDFFVYAIASVIVFPTVVFGFTDDPLTATLWSFAAFALAFVARPVGTVVFNAIDRAYGKSTRLTIALLVLGCSTVAIAFLPSYDTVGWYAVLILAVFRLGQGFALGGTWDGMASLLAMNAPRHKHGFYAMVPQLGAPLGLLVAAGLFVYLVTALTPAEFDEWGWRFPFFVAFAINVVALFARLRIVATDEYAELYESRELEPTAITATIAAEGRNILIGAFAPLASFALFHMVTVFPLSWVYLYANETPARFLGFELVGACFGLASVYLSGGLSDRYGRRNLLIWSAIGIALFSIVAPLLLSAGAFGEVVFMIVGFSLLGISFGQSSGAVASRFNPGYRYTASALTSDLAWFFGAGFAPLVALLLSSWFGLFWAGAYLLSGAVVTILALSVVRELEFRS